MSSPGRRHFLFFSVAFIAPLDAQAQSTKVWRIGYLTGQRKTAATEPSFSEPFLLGMRELGYIEGKNVQYEWRFADGEYERLPSLAAELVGLAVDLIVAVGTPAALAAQRSTKTIPIVIPSVANPLDTGLVASMGHPGGNITGVSNFLGDVGEKQLELLVAAIPKLSLVGVLLNPTNPSTEPIFKSAQAASHRLAVRLLRLEASTPEEIDRAFSTMKRERVQAYLQIADNFFYQQQVQTVKLAEKFRIPGMYPGRAYVAVGGLISYGANISVVSRRTATYVDKILRGAKPAELPVEQPTKLELLINLRTAKTLGITISQSVLAWADEVIQ